MKRNFYIFFIFCLISGHTFAQSDGTTIIEEINSSKWGQGNVKVMQDEAIENILAIRRQGTIDSTRQLGAIDPNAEFIKVKGFKIQVFSGNNQQRSKQEAESKQAQVKAEYPDLEAVVNFQSPFWRLRVGNFLTKEDADTVLKEMKTKFTSFGREMYVVSDVVKKNVETKIEN